MFGNFSPDPQRDTFWDFLRFRARGPGDSCKWRLGSQKSIIKLGKRKTRYCQFDPFLPRHSGKKTRNASKQGVSQRFGVFLRPELSLDELNRLDSAQFLLRIIFAGLTIFFFGSSNFWPNWVWKAKNGLGLQNWGRFENDVFRIFPRVGLVAKNGLAAAVQRVFAIFSGFSFDTIFANLKRNSSNSPLLLFAFFSFLRFLLGFGVNATLHVCFWRVGPKASFFFCFCLFITKQCFPPEKGYFC